MPTKRRNSSAWCVMIRDAQGERLIAFVAAQADALRWSASFWASRTQPCAVRVVRFTKAGRESKSVLVGSDLNAKPRAKASALGDYRDTWEHWEPCAFGE